MTRSQKIQAILSCLFAVAAGIVWMTVSWVPALVLVLVAWVLADPLGSRRHPRR